MRVYNRDYSWTSEDEDLKGALRVLRLRSDESDTIEWRENYKHLCNVVRESIGMTDVVCLAFDDYNNVLIIPFGVQATEDNFYTMVFDTETDSFYIEVEEGVVLND